MLPPPEERPDEAEIERLAAYQAFCIEITSSKAPGNDRRSFGSGRQSLQIVQWKRCTETGRSGRRPLESEAIAPPHKESSSKRPTITLCGHRC